MALFALVGQLLQLSPTEEIVFRREDGETTGLLTMTNTSDGAVAYKVRIIPDMFWHFPISYLVEHILVLS